MTWIEPDDDDDCLSPYDRQVMRGYARRTGMETWFTERRGETHWAWAAWEASHSG